MAERALLTLYAALEPERALARDPVRFVRRYSRPEDIEIAGVFASQLAYGRVELFGAVLDRLFDHFDAHGGPRAFVDGFDVDRAEGLDGFLYRWNRPIDWVLFCAALQRITEVHGSLEPTFAGDSGREALTAGLTVLRREVRESARTFLPTVAGYADLPRGTRNWLSSPVDGSACKRWNLFLRWMVRPTTEGIDLGIWRSLSPAHLVIPLDTHVHRVSRFLGLTGRKTANWKTAEAITASLARIDPVDPLRFDFALAHVGISGGCRGYRHDEVCPACPLDPWCTAETRAAQ